MSSYNWEVEGPGGSDSDTVPHGFDSVKFTYDAGSDLLIDFRINGSHKTLMSSGNESSCYSCEPGDSIEAKDNSDKEDTAKGQFIYLVTC